MVTRLLVFAMAGALWCAAADLRFHPGEKNAFAFDTGVLKGQLRNEGRSIGLLPVTHVPSGAALAHSMGLFSVYRVFSNGQRYRDGMWDWPSKAKSTGDGAIEVIWPVAEGREFEMRAVYRLVAPNTLDLVITVRPGRDLRGFEAFLAAYFGEGLTTSAVLVEGGRFKAADRANGQWQMFPRSADAVSLIRDGRWKLPPHPVDWAILPEFEAPAQDCFAVATPEQGDSHRSIYLSLFGRDLDKDVTARARARLVILSSPDEDTVRKLYDSYTTGK